MPDRASAPSDAEHGLQRPAHHRYVRFDARPQLETDSPLIDQHPQPVQGAVGELAAMTLEFTGGTLAKATS